MKGIKMNNQLHSAEDKPGANQPDCRKLIIASNNEGKLREFRKLLEPFGFDVISMRQAGFKDCHRKSLSLGIAQIYIGQKPE